MKDKEVFEMLTNSTNSRLKEEKIFAEKFPEIYLEIMNSVFPGGFKFPQKLYHYFLDDIGLSLGLCNCGKRCRFISFKSGYVKHCSKKCAMGDDVTKRKYVETCLDMYGVENVAKSDDIKIKKKITCNEKYGVDNVFQLSETKEKRRETLVGKFGVEHPMKSETCKENYMKTTKERYGVDFYMQSEEGKERYRETCKEKYGANWFSKSDDYKNMHDIIQEKINSSKRKNKTFNSSKIEQQVEEYFKSREVKFAKQYVSKDYPFFCDFYLPDYDIYIEIQGTWTHGGHPFDINNQDDIDKLNFWKSKNNRYYDNAIETWTQRDVRKRETAKANNLNFVEIFSNKIDEVLKTIEGLLFFQMKV